MCFINELVYLLYKFMELKFLLSGKWIFNFDSYCQAAFKVITSICILTYSAEKCFCPHTSCQYHLLSHHFDLSKNIFHCSLNCAGLIKNMNILSHFYKDFMLPFLWVHNLGLILYLLKHEYVINDESLPYVLSFFFFSLFFSILFFQPW